MTEDKHKRITQAQLELWLENSTTKTYLQCLRWSAEQVEEMLGNGGQIDTSNNDLSMNRIHSSLGKKNGLISAAGYSISQEGKETFDPTPIFNTHEMLELPKEEEDENNG